MVIPALAALLWLAAAPAVADRANDPPPMDFVLPEPGTYALQHIMRAPDGPVLGRGEPPQAQA